MYLQNCMGVSDIMYSVRCFLKHVPAVFAVYSVVYNSGKIIMGIENESYLSADCDDFADYEMITDSLYAYGKVNIGEKYNFAWI